MKLNRAASFLCLLSVLSLPVGLACFWACSASAANPLPRNTGATAKPSPPLTFEFKSAASPTPGTVGYEVSVRVAVPSNKVEFKVVIPEGVQIASGPETWSGAIQDVQTLDYSFVVPDDERYSVKFLGRMQVGADDFQAGAAALTIDLGPPSDRRFKGKRRVDARGNSLRTYEAR